MRFFIEENINLHDELKPVVASVQTLLKDRTVTFVEAVDANLPIMIGDKRRIRQILLNLLSNSAKFTEQGSITLTVKNQGDEVLFSVADTGPGIAPEIRALFSSRSSRHKRAFDMPMVLAWGCLSPGGWPKRMADGCGWKANQGRAQHST